MAGYVGTKAVLLSTTAATVGGDADIGGDLTVDTNTLYVDSTNNRVGIGTSSPVGVLDVKEAGAPTAVSGFEMSRIAGADAVANDLTLLGPNTSQIRINFGDPEDANVGEIGYNHSTNTMRFVTSATERMSIDSSGNLLVGTTSDLGKLTVYDTRTTSGSAAFMVRCAGGSNEGLFVRSDGYCSMPWTYSNATSGASANMVIGSGGFIYRSTSSLKYKNNIQDTPHGLAEVMTLRPVTYTGKSEQDGDTVFGGLIAEEVHAAGLTEFVSYDENGEPDAIHYGQMVSLAFKAIQEQNAALQEALDEITDLKARVVALEAN